MVKSDLFKKFLEQKTNYNELVKHQIDSYNYFVKYGMKKVLDEIGVQEINITDEEQIKIRLSNIKIGTPSIKEVDGSKRILTPFEARTRDLNYMIPVYVDVVPYFGSKECIPKQTELYHLPIMVNSCICLLNNMNHEEKIKIGEDPYDPGGYFIINGTERTIVNFEYIASNKLILRKKDKDISVRIDSTYNGFTQKHSFEKTKKGLVVARFSMFSKEPIPIVILMKILGIEKDKDVVNAITSNEAEKEDIYLNLMQCNCPTKKECFSYISELVNLKEEKENTIIYQRMDTNLLAFIGTDEKSRIQKAIYLAKIFRKLIRLHNNELSDEDIDHYSNKRIRTVGELLENLFRYSIIGKWGLISKLQFNYQRLLRRGKKILRLEEMISQNTMTKQILRAMATGNWISGETGVCQRLERTNYMRSQEHARSIISPLTPSQEHFDARELHCTHWGRLCPVRTPEGQNIGLRKYLAIGGQITEEIDEKTAEEVNNKIKKIM